MVGGAGGALLTAAKTCSSLGPRSKTRQPSVGARSSVPVVAVTRSFELTSRRAESTRKGLPAFLGVGKVPIERRLWDPETLRSRDRAAAVALEPIEQQLLPEDEDGLSVCEVVVLEEHFRVAVLWSGQDFRSQSLDVRNIDPRSRRCVRHQT